MASVAQYQGKATSPGHVGRARRSAGPDSLAIFRVPAEAERERSLSALIEREIIPRLMVAHSVSPLPVRSPAGGHHIDPDEIAAFAPLVMQVEADALLAQIEAMLARGVAFDAVLVDLLAPTARLLGEYWEEDRCDFVDVTMGLWRLQEVIHELSGRVPAPRTATGRRVLFAAMPGDQHNFGTVVIDEMFRRDGWHTERAIDAEPAELIRRVAETWYDMVGLTISCDCHIENLPSTIAAVRNVSRNPRVCVMVGGRIFSATPELAAIVGADGTAGDARAALLVAADLVREREREAAV